MRVLITGGAGFIGSHLASHYLQSGCEVEIFDRNLSKCAEGLILFLGRNSKVTLTDGDVKDSQKIRESVQRADIVIHLAAAVGVKYIIDNASESISNNIMGTHELLTACVEFGKKVFYASSSEVYGKSARGVFAETDNSIIGPSNKKRWSYSTGKLLGEFLAVALSEEHALQVVVGRLFNIVGSRQSASYGMVLPRFVEQALHGIDITVYGDGMQVRTFLHVRDATKIISKLMAAPEACGQVVNIGGIDEVRIIDLAKMVVDQTQSKSKIVFVPHEQVYPKGFEDILRRKPCLKKLSGIIGDYTYLDLMSAIADSIEGFRVRN